MKKIITLTFISTFAFCVSCNEDALDKVNPNDFSPATFYKTGPQLESAVNAAYSSFQSFQLYAREYFFVHDMRSDEMQVGGELEAARRQLLSGNQTTTNPLINDVWNGWYRMIHQTNQVIANEASAVENITPEFKARVLGEAKFLRALAYFDLVVLFGGVPLMLEPASTIDDDLPRASVEQVYTQIISDLTDAIAGLPNKSGYNSNNIARANKQAAQTLLGRVYMQQGKHDLARTQFLEVVNSGEFTNWNKVPYWHNFDEEHEYNAESIFEVSFTTAFADFSWDPTAQGQGQESTLRGQEYAPQPAGWRNLIPSDALLAAFEPNDPRYAVSFYSPGDLFHDSTKTIDPSLFGVPKPVSWRKYTRMYKAPIENAKSGINFRVMRFAEVLLNLAECEAMLDNYGAAIGYVNQVRAREGVEMPALVAANFGDRASTMAAVIQERRVELNGEQHRNRDILRWRALGVANIEPVAGFKDLLPIPQNELNNNKKLTPADQNPGY